MGRPLRLGLIGAGRWGRNYIKTIAALEGVQLTHLASRNPDSLQLVANDCIVCADWRAILDPRYLDGVIIATPPALHAEMARAAVEAGLPALVEKPLTLSVAEAVALRQFVAARGGFVMVGHTHLFHPAFRALKRLAPRYGTICAIRSEAGNHGPFRADTPVLWDWGAHDVAMCLDLVGAVPEHVEARRLESRPVEGALGEIIKLTLQFPKGLQADIRIGNVMPKRRWLAAHFKTTILVFDDLAPNKLALYPATANYAAPEGTGKPVEISSELPLTNVIGDFTAAIRDGNQDLSTLDLGMSVVATLARCAPAL